MKSYRNYTDEDIISAVSLSNSVAGVIRKLGLIPAGGNYSTITQAIQRLGLDTTHFTGLAHNKNREFKPFDNLKNKASIKLRLIKERTHKCENCNLSTWLNEKIVLELEHVDGNRHNNSRDNLKLLCPNCHSLTPTWRGRNIKSAPPKTCPECSGKISPRAKLCAKCTIEHRKKTRKQRVCTSIPRPTKINWPTKEELAKLVWEQPRSGLAKQLGVSDTAIAKHCNKLGIPQPKRGHWAKT